METPQATARAELRRATVLFVDLVGFTAISEAEDPERAYLLVTSCLKLLDGIARRHGGSVDKFQGDALMAVFGTPVPIDEPEAAALRAAAEMREQVRETSAELELTVPLEVRIGVNTGDVVAGDIRGPVVREFHLLGDAVNVAARLKSKAPLGSIYLGPATHDATLDRFEFRDLEAMQLKGKQERVATYELLGARADAHSASRSLATANLADLVGRREELGRLEARLAALAGGAGATVCVVGEEGSGKSRLLAELASRAAGRDIPVVAIHARDGPSQLGAALRDRLDPSQPGPTVLLIDEADRADAQSLELLARRLPALAERPVLLVLALRPGSTGEALRETIEGAGHAMDTLTLAPLTDAEANALIGALSTEDLDEDTRRLVAARGGGNPGRLIMASFLAPALRSAAEQEGQGPERSSEAERRRVTILFADITGFTAMTERMGAEKAYPIVADCLRILDEVTRTYGGTVDHYLGDCVMSLFGVAEAIEDAPRAAVNAAIEMRKRVQDYTRDNQLESPLDVHTGINTALGITGDVSGPLLREFSVMGDSVNVADQLTDLAPAGRIFIGPETRRLTADVFQFEPLEPITPTGQSQTIEAFELLSDEVQIYRRRAGGGEISSVLVGREQELTRLQQRVRGLTDGTGAVAGVVAEAGIGKSRLVDELHQFGSEQGVLWLEGRSLSTGSQLSFHPFADLLRSWAGIREGEDASEAVRRVEEAVRRLLPEEVDDVFPLIGTVMGLPLPERLRARVEGIQGEVLDKFVRNSVTRLLSRQSELQPLALVFDDLHWADGSSIELLESLQRLVEDHPIFFLHVARPGFAETSGRVLERAQRDHPDRFESITLEPLDREASRQLINNLFRNADIPHALRSLIIERAAGNPFYVEEVVRSLLEEGAVEVHGEEFRATEKIHSVVIPGTVQEVIMARVDRLVLRQRQLMQVASVVGRSFHLEVLGQIFQDKDQLKADIESLRQDQFLVSWDRTQGIQYAFKHPLIQEVVYDSLLKTRREELHLDVGNAIEVTLTRNVTGYNAMLAYHFSLGRDLERAEEYLFKAGDEAARSAASNEALGFFRQASQLYLEMHGGGGDPEKRAHLQKNMGLALFNRGQLIEAVEHLDSSLRLLGQRVPTRLAALVGRFVVNFSGLLGHLYLGGAGHSHPDASDREREIIDISFRKGLAQTTTDPVRFVFDTMATLRRISKLEPRSVPEFGGIFSGAMGIFSYGGLSFALGQKCLDRAAENIGEENELFLYHRACNFIHNYFKGDWSPDHEIADALLESNLRDGRLWEVTTYVGLNAEIRWRRGQFAAARERMQMMDWIWETYEYDLAKTNYYGLPALIQLEERTLAQCRKSADVYYQELPEDLLHLLALGTRAHAETLMGDLDEADGTLARAAEIVKRSGPAAIPYHLSSYLEARLLLELTRMEASMGGDGSSRGWRRRTRKTARAALRVAGQVAHRKPAVHRLLGRRAWLLGKQDEALEHWQRSLAESERLGTLPELARTLHEMGLRGAGDDSTSHRDRARGIFDELGLAWDVERLESGSPP